MENKGVDEHISHQIIDMIIDSTLKKHEIKLKEKQLDDETKEQLRTLVKDLQNSVQSLTKEKTSDE